MYQGITHYIPLWLLPLWKWIFCSHRWHLWDEVWSPDGHYLVCDACDKVVYMKE